MMDILYILFEEVIFNVEKQLNLTNQKQDS